MKRKELARLAIVIIGIVIITIIIKLIQGMDTTKKDLKKLGYNKEEIEYLIENLDKDNIRKILDIEYSDKLVKIMKEEYYIPYNLYTYLNYSKTEEDIKKVISKVNVGSYKAFYENAKETDVSKGNSMLVNKFNYLPMEYDKLVENQIVSIKNWYAFDGNKTLDEVYDHFIDMWKQTEELGYKIIINSSYRTLEEQEEEYENYGDTLASRPGFSEHQTGLALDITTYNVTGNEFATTDEYKWLQNNAHKYGFILRYPEGKEDITGYSYESWHYRYLGVELATKVKNSNLTYDEYYAYYCEYKNEC